MIDSHIWLKMMMNISLYTVVELITAVSAHIVVHDNIINDIIIIN